jgi:hypothetical protein
VVEAPPEAGNVDVMLTIEASKVDNEVTPPADAGAPEAAPPPLPPVDAGSSPERDAAPPPPPVDAAPDAPAVDPACTFESGFSVTYCTHTAATPSGYACSGTASPYAGCLIYYAPGATLPPGKAFWYCCP